MPVTLPRAGRYQVLVDVYPAASAGPRNFQLTRDLQVGSGDVKAPLPAYAPVVQGRRPHVPGRQAAGAAPAPSRARWSST